MKYYLIAGERSGDLHGSNLIKAICRHDPQAECRAWGGEQMQQAGATLVTHYAEMAFMGFWEVFKNLFKIRSFLRKCQSDILEYQPDVVILIDYAGFNMRIARFAKEHGLRTFYYISPKVWAWNQSRALNIKRYVDRLFVIFPFEKEFFKRFDYEVDYVGNPLFDAIADFTPEPDFRVKHQLDPHKPIVALLPGSRRQEVEQMLAVMVATQTEFEAHQYVIAAVSNLPKSLYDSYQALGCRVVTDAAYDLLSVATAALVTSGTATLETALFEVPQVVCYRTSGLSYQIGKRLIRVPFISLVNLIANREVVKELIQNDFTPHLLADELRRILPNGSRYESQREGYREIKQILGDKGASDRAGQLMVAYLQNKAIS
ncbi:MAG: lipid-A-disaccharide synthase [Spirosomaceae bacterium]|jgi:lipid-A-disaccharide synthase|nr:lipid-A-disaccharide synthase [Spirosomataceae bacterium]